MISCGNDIIFLENTSARCTNTSFYSKILAPSEVELHRSGISALSFQHFVWLLWSVKESVYKYQNRKDGSLAFSPTKIIVESISLPTQHNVCAFVGGEQESSSVDAGECYLCMVRWGPEIFYSASRVCGEFIYTQADNDRSFDHIFWGIKFIPEAEYENQSKEVRAFVLRKLSLLFPGDQLHISKSAAGFPLLFNEKEAMSVPISFTHHGHLIGYSFYYNARSGHEPGQHKVREELHFHM